MFMKKISKDSLLDLIKEFKSFKIEHISLYGAYTLKETIKNNNGVSMNKLIGNISRLNANVYLLKIFENPTYARGDSFEQVMSKYSLE